MTTAFPKGAGIYCITNILNRRVYIGSSVDLYTRRCHHLSDLRHNRHRNTHLQNSWNRYGEDAFEFSILKLCSRDELKKWEDYLIRNNPNHYNILDQSYSTYGYKHTDDAKRKIGEASANRKRRHWTLAERIGQSLKLIGKTYPDKKSQIEKIVAKTKGRKRSPESIERYRISKLGNDFGAKEYAIMAPDGTVFHGHNLKQFCRDKGLDYHISSARQWRGWVLL